MSRRQAVPQQLKQQVMEDAKYRCGYCLTQQRIIGRPLSMEHLLPVARGGETTRANLWLACRRCNEFRGARTEALDPMTGTMATLFNPRTQSWSTHFIWSDDSTEIIGLTPTGRATVATLRLNNADIKQARGLWVLIGLHPPSD
ncbi:MAG: HNH endonuclease [Anaerolineales bacterium]|nr:HNH endonuclease [Anaerolineales bacterium]